jgi:hypothetical protein
MAPVRDMGHQPAGVASILIASGTRPRPACRRLPPAAPPAPVRRSFLNASCVSGSLEGCFGRTDRRAKPSRCSSLPTERSCKPTSKRLEASLPTDQRLQIDPPPAHHAVARRVRSPLHDPFQRPGLLAREPRPWPQVGPVTQAGETLGVVAMHPIPQGLPVHAGVPRRRRARGPFQHQRQGEHPPRRPRVPAARRLPPQGARAQLPSGDRHRHDSLRGPDTPPINAAVPRTAPTQTGQRPGPLV